MKKNRIKTIDLNHEIRRCGNWNFRNRELKPVYSKPIAVIKLDQDEFVWNHEEVLKLIQIYHEVDKESISMINDKEIDTGEINFAEISFLDKIKNKIEELENED